MKISIVVPDFARSIVGVAAIMKRYLSDEHEVEIVGTRLWGRVETAYSQDADYRVLDLPRIYRLPEYWRDVGRLADALTGDVVFAMKAYAPAVPAALLAKKRRGCKVVSYQDEWDGAPNAEWGLRERLGNLRRDWKHPCDSLYVPHVERRLAECDLRLCTTTFLAEKFGGEVYCIGVDCEKFRPARGADVRRLRGELGLEGKFALVFGGVARPHKGLEPYAEAVAEVFGDTGRLVILGPMDAYVQELMSHPRYGRNVICPVTADAMNLTIHKEMPLYLSAGDALAVPLSGDLLARSQMPRKVFDAMAMGKPIVASAVADLPQVLEGCGYLTAAGDSGAVAAALRRIAENPAGAAAMGARAREKCLREYSAERAKTRLQEIVRRVVGASRTAKKDSFERDLHCAGNACRLRMERPVRHDAASAATRLRGIVRDLLHPSPRKDAP